MELLSPKGAARLLSATPQALFVDCRSEREYRFVGHPVGAQHVAWHSEPGWEINPHFVAAVRGLAGEDTGRPVVLICRTGERAQDAGRALEAAGFARVFAVETGFEGDVDASGQRGKVNGWRADGLPWETSACQQCGTAG